jgi:uncharacterized protein with GYD domain
MPTWPDCCSGPRPVVASSKPPGYALRRLRACRVKTKGGRVPKYVTLYNWTDQGAASVKETVNRYQAAKQFAESKGGKLETTLWTVGPYDLVGISDFPDDETGTAVALQIASTGAIRTVTMRAFDEDQMKAIIAKMG